MKQKTQEKRPLRTIRNLCLIPALLMSLMLLSACGNQEMADADDYVYLFGEISDYDLSSDCSMFSGNFKGADGYLYYMDESIYRIPLSEKADFSQRELVLDRSSLASYSEDQIFCFTLDENQNLYYCGRSDKNNSFSLYRHSPEGELLFRLPLEKESITSRCSTGSSIAVDQEGTAYLLSDQSLLRVNAQGELTAKLSLADELGGTGNRVYLLGTPDGHIYLFSEYMANRKCFEISKEDTPRLTLISSLSEEMAFSSLYEGQDGLLISAEDGCLYQYNPDTDTSEAILRWEDCDINPNSIYVIAPLSEEIIFLSAKKNGSDTEAEGLLLNKIPASEAPQKEKIVLASLVPSTELKAAVIDFNRSSTRYHVSIESYGLVSVGFGYQGDMDAAIVRLDSALTGSETPDLLDLSFRNFRNKYAVIGALEDLSPYIEESSCINREDFLPNLLEGYTADGALISIPQSFQVLLSYSADPRIEELEDWSMDSLMALDEKYPDTPLFSGKTSSWMFLHKICSSYYLDTYVDWEKGECSFDSEGFRVLLKWLKTQLSASSEESLLNVRYINSFDDWTDFLGQHDESTRLYGLPSADGKPEYSVDINDLVAMLKNSRHKEGAWAFLEYYFQRGYQSNINAFPARLDRLKEAAETVQKPAPGLSGGGFNAYKAYLGNYGEMIMIPPLKQEDVDVLWDLLYSLDFTPQSTEEEAIIEIVSEEAQAFFDNAKTAEEVTSIIQSRAQIVIQENR